MNLGDYIRVSLSWADEQLLRCIGRFITHLESGQKFRAVYEYPKTNVKFFGITDDEMKVQLGYNTVLGALGRLPQIGDIFVDDRGEAWRVVLKLRENSFWLGDNRLALVVTRHAESKVGDPSLQTSPAE